MVQPLPTAGIEGLDDEIVLTTEFQGKDEGYYLVVAKYELVRLIVLEIEASRHEPRRMDIIKSNVKEKMGKSSFVKSTYTAPSKSIGALLKEAKELRRAITGRGAPDMPLPIPLVIWMEQNGIANNLL